MRRPQLGIRHRLLLTVVVAVALGLTVSVVAFDLVLDRQLSLQATSLARQQARVAVAALRVESGVIDASDVGEPADLSSRVWVYQGSRALVAPRVGEQLQAAADALAAGNRTTTRLDEQARLYAAPVLSGSERVGTVVAAVSTRGFERTAHATLIGSIALAIAVLLVVVLLSGWMLRRALRPVARMTADAESWSAHDLERRFAMGEPRDELTQLGATLDHLMTRIATALHHEQRFTAELSHELRTPLSRIAAEAELALGRERPAADYRDALTAIASSASELQETMDALLAAARAEAGIAQGTSDARESAASVVESLRMLAEERGLALGVEDGPPALVPLEPTLVERMLAPVVDNACRYAESTVHVRVGTRPDAVEITVDDDGPGVAEEERERIFEPGARGRAAPGSPHGAGLGLALARRLARSAGGEVTATPSREGGRFVIRLPAP